AKGALNGVVAMDWADFDMEAFEHLVDQLLETLAAVSPRRLADDVVVEIRERPDNRGYRTATEHSSPPALTVLWGTIHGVLRAKVEAELRRWKPPARGQVLALLAHINGLLEEHRPRLPPGRRNALISNYLRKVAAIWRRCRLKGRAYDGMKGKRVAS